MSWRPFIVGRKQIGSWSHNIVCKAVYPYTQNKDMKTPQKLSHCSLFTLLAKCYLLLGLWKNKRCIMDVQWWTFKVPTKTDRTEELKVKRHFRRISKNKADLPQFDHNIFKMDDGHRGSLKSLNCEEEFLCCLSPVILRHEDMSDLTENITEKYLKR